MNQEGRDKDKTYTRIGVMKDSKTKPEESTRLVYTGLCHSSWDTHLDTSDSQRYPVSVGLSIGCHGHRILYYYESIK